VDKVLAVITLQSRRHQLDCLAVRVVQVLMEVQVAAVVFLMLAVSARLTQVQVVVEQGKTL
jgi:hypothetical protein